MLSTETRNVLQLGLGLCLIFAAYSSQAFVVEPVMAHRHEVDPRFSPYAGYYRAMIVCFSFMISNLIAPPIVKFLTPKWSVVFGSAGYTIYMAGFMFLDPIFLYLSSAAEGLCGGVMWTALGVILSQNSNDKTITRNSGIMWIVSMFSMVIGGIFLLATFSTSSENEFSDTLTKTVYLGCFLFALAGNLCFVFLQKTETKEKIEEEEGSVYWNELKKTVLLMKSTDMLLLFPIFALTGMELSFYGTIYTTAISFTTAFSTNTNVLIAWCSIITGVGQITAGLPLVIFGKRLSRFGYSPLIFLGCISGGIAVLLVFINIPGNATFERTDGIALLLPSVPITLLASFLFGISDSFVNIALFAYLSTRYPEETTQAFALMKLLHAVSTAMFFYYGTWLQLHWQLLIIGTCCLVSLFSFAATEKRSREIKLQM